MRPTRDPLPSASSASGGAARALASAADSGPRARPVQPRRRSSPADPAPPGYPALGFASCAAFEEPPPACHLTPAPPARCWASRGAWRFGTWTDVWVLASGRARFGEMGASGRSPVNLNALLGGGGGGPRG